MTMTCDRIDLWQFGCSLSSTTVSFSPDIFRDAVISGDFSERRAIHQHLAWGESPDYLRFPVVFHKDDGRVFRDLLPMGYGGKPFLISERAMRVLQDNKVSGWKTYPITLYDKKNQIITGYHGFSTIGKGGAMKGFQTSEWERITQGNKLEYDISQWDGSDIFRIQPAFLVVTEKVKDLFLKFNLSGAYFWPLSDRVNY